MSIGEALYLTLVITAMLVFAGTLAWVSRRPASERRTSRLPDRRESHSPNILPSR